MDRRPYALYLLAAATAALVVVGVSQAHGAPDLAPGGGGEAALALQLVAGLALALAAIHVARRRELALSGALLVAAGGLGFHVLPTPPDGALLFTLALVGAGAAPAAAAHAALRHPGGHAPGRFDRAAIAIGYGAHVAILGLVPALVFDPEATGCSTCPGNLLLVHSDPGFAEWLARWGPRVAAVTEVALAALVLWRLLRRPPVARGLAAPVSAAACLVLVLAAIGNLRAARGLAGTTTDRDLWLATATALGLLAAGLAWRPLRAARVRASLGRLAVAPASGEDVRAVLARALGDPSVSVVLPHPETGAPIAPDGAPAPVAAGRARTAVERRGRVVAWLEHRDSLQATPELPVALARTAGLTLEREALRAAQRVQERELRASTLRLVAAGEVERRRLERDLHDGAQQRLLGLALKLARPRPATADGEAETLTDAADRVGAIRDQLRRVAHGIHSVTLLEGGLAEAVLALVEISGGGVTVDALPERRGSPEAEAAVYRLVAASLRLATEHGVRLAIHARERELDAAVRVSGAAPAVVAHALAHAGARVAALGGSLTVEAEGAGAVVRARVPLAAERS